MSLSEFYREWFGIHGGREILLSYNEKVRDRLFITSSEELEDYIELCRGMGAPAYVSVQPYQAKDQLLGIEKLFFEFDCPEDPRRAWLDTKALADNIIRYYDATPLLKFSGRKGYHVDVFLQQTVAFDPNIHSIEFVKAVYKRLQEKILLGLILPTLDRQVIGDIKRLERIPYSTHEATGSLCQPVNLDGKPLGPEECDVEFYRKNGLSAKLLEHVIQELINEEKWKAHGKKGAYYAKLWGDKRIRPCIKAILADPDPAHKMRVALVAECHAAGYSPEEIMEMFKRFRDYDERKTRYQVMDIIEGAYKPFRCRTIRELGFCLPECPRRG